MLKTKTCFDEILEHLDNSTITTIYGPPAIGKTTLSYLYINDCLNKKMKAIYIDTEGGFSIERLKQINPNINLNDIFIFKITNFEKQKKTIKELNTQIKKIKKLGLIVVDSLVMLYRLKLGEEDNEYKKTNSELGEQLRLLNEICRNHKIPILIINQMYRVFDEKKQMNYNKMIGGDIIYFWAKTVIELDNLDGVKSAKLIKHKSIKEGDTINYELVNFGIKKSKSKSFNLFKS